MLRLHATRRLGAFRLDAALEAASGSVLVLAGESGSGKTTLLRLLAGLLHPEQGRIELDGEVWFEGPRGRVRPARTRPVGYVAHLTAAENVAFGLHAQGLRGPAVRARAVAALERLGIGGLAARRPGEISGGQRQRVAIARAVVLEPRLLLLDEPLSALDARSRRGIRVELRRLLAEIGCTTVIVTHSPAEALALGQRLAVIEHGRITQSGPPSELLRHPRSAYVAEFLGVNLLLGSPAGAATPEARRIVTAHGELELAGAAGEGEIAIVVHPRDITLSLERPCGTARNVFEGVIEELAPEPPGGELVRVSLATSPPLMAQVTPQAVAALGLRPGLPVFASFKAAGVLPAD